MLDLKIFRENPEIIIADLKKRNMTRLVDLVSKVKKTDEEVRERRQKRESYVHKQKLVSENFPKLITQIGELKKASPEKKKELNALEEKLRNLKEEGEIEKKKIKELDKKLEELEEWLLGEGLYLFPNLTHDSTPEGPDESGNVVEKTHGTPRTFDFTPKDHVELGTALGILNLEDATRMSGTRFAYLLGDAALLEFALIQFVMHKLVAKGFTPVVPPVLVREHAMTATGFFPADRNEIYHVNPKQHEDDKENDDLYLVGTAEVPLTMLHADKIIPEEKLPLRYVGFSTCFRREAGSYGKDTQGIIRVHQFDKIEMFSFCHPDKSWEEHELIRSIEEEIMQALGFAYQVLNICSGDLGYPAAKKYDLEAWIPTQGKYRELTSCSNCTDYQARRAKIRYKTTEGKNEFLHTLNGTACAIGRTLVALFETHQQADGTISIPEVLQPYMNGKTVISGPKS